MNQKQKKLMFNQSFKTGGRTVFKVGGGFEILNKTIDSKVLVL